MEQNTPKFRLRLNLFDAIVLADIDSLKTGISILLIDHKPVFLYKPVRIQ